MKLKIFSLILMLAVLSCVIFISATASTEKEDAMIAIEADATLSAFKQGETISLATDGYIGIPVEITVYYDGTSAATPGPQLDSTPVVLYVVNAELERIGTDSDVDIIRRMVSNGYAVAVLDYLNNPKATSPKLDWSAQTVRNQLKSGAYFTDKTVFPEGTYYNSFVVPSGYDISINNVFWEIDKHSTDGTFEKIVEIWNNDFRGVKGDIIIKWTDENGNRKATGNGFDGSEPIWLDSDGSENPSGEYIRIKHTRAEKIEDCVKADGSPIDLNLYMHFIYPTGNVTVPVMTLVGSAEHLANGAATADRPQFVGAVFNGYAGVMYDHGYTPMARDDHYGYFDGNAAKGHVTGDNLTYSIQFYNSVEINTAAMRYIRYTSLTSDKMSFKLDAIGAYGNSKGGWMQFLGEEDPYATPNRRIYPDHHGETRYEAGKTETIGVIDGGEEQPWLTYNGEIIDGGADLIYCSCGGTVDSITSTHAPTFITCNLTDGSYYWTSNDFVNICRSVDARAMWFEVALGHTFGYGQDMNHGVDVYEAFFDFSGYWLKGDAVKVSYITSDISYGGMPTYAPITVKFTGSVDEIELDAITLSSKNGEVATGYWTSAFGNTEWTFHPDPLKSNTEYTLTVPAGIRGDNGVPMTESRSFTYTTGYELEYTGEEIRRVAGARGTCLSFAVPSPNVTSEFNANKYIVRINVKNDAANQLGVYSLNGFNPENPDAAGIVKQVGSIAVNGRGYYEIDITEFVGGMTAGESCSLLIKEEKAVAENRVYTATFEGKIDSGMSISNTVSREATTLDGNGVLKIYGQSLVTTYTNNTFYGGHSLGASLACFGAIGGKELTEKDTGRRFEISFRVFDTTERYLGVNLNDCTSSGTGIVDYGGYNYNFKTKANEWVEFSFIYNVYEPEAFGSAGLGAKNLFITVPGYGTDPMPIYFDSFTSTEITTEVELAEENGATLVLTTTEQRRDPLETPYGTIPEAYADVETYPFAIFSKSGNGYTFITALNDVFADSTVTNYWGINSEITVYMRRDYTATSRFTNLRQVLVGMCFDLGDNTLTANSAWQTIYVLGNSPRVASVSSLSLKFKNGYIATDSAKAFLLVGSNTAGVSAEYDIEFEGITFTRPESSTNAHPIVEFTSSTNTFNTNITYNDCTFDMRGKETVLRIFTAGNSANTARANVVVNGGKIILSTTNKIALTYAVGNDSSVRFGSGTDGYVRISVPTDSAAPTFSVTTKNGDNLSFVKDTSENGFDIYKPATLKTPYGEIPSQYASEQDYPFVLYRKDGDSYTFITALKDVFADSSVTNYWGIKSEITIYMRRDYTATSRFTNLRQIMVGMCFDLGGNTLTANSASQTFYILGNPPRDASVTALSVKFKNGYIATDSAKAFLLVGSNTAGGDKVKYSASFENVTFTRPASSTNAHPIVEFTLSTSTFNTDITFTDCTFDMRGKETVLRIFTAGNTANTARANVVVNGGEVILSTSVKIALTYVSGADSSVRFGEGSNGYIKVKMPTGTAPLNADIKSTEGLSCSLVKSATESGMDVYAVTPKLLQGFGIKANATLYTDFGFNVYIPWTDAVSIIRLDGVVYDLGSLETKTLGDKVYYVLSTRIPVNEAARTLTLSVTLSENGGASIEKTWALDVISYTSLIIEGDYTDLEKTLARDILSYVRAAYAYEKLDTSAVERIDAIIGTDYDTENVATVPDAKIGTDGLKSAALLLGSSPCYVFTVADGYNADDFVFAIDGKYLAEFETVVEGKETKLIVKLPAFTMNMDIEYMIKGTDVSGIYNIGAYHEFAVNSGDAALVRFVERLVKYAESAEAYRNAQVN